MDAKTKEKLSKLLTPLSHQDLREVAGLLKEFYRRADARQVLEFLPGQKVAFKGRNGIRTEATVIKANKTTVSVKATDGVQWKVSPGLLTPVG